MKRTALWVSNNFWPLLPVLLGLVALAVLASGCGSWTTQTPWPLRAEVHSKGARPSKPRMVTAATPVERALAARGLRFGTDGSVAALYSYTTSRHSIIDPRQARPGDLVFFAAAANGSGCASHVGIVEGVQAGGVLRFSELRDGQSRQSVVDPMRPRRRRDDQGRIINTFLRARQPDDSPSTRYYAGEMLCAVVRVR